MPEFLECSCGGSRLRRPDNTFVPCAKCGAGGEPRDSAVEHPAHYGGADNPYETVKVIEAWLEPAEYIGGLKFNYLKYLSRAGKKGAALTDLKKARWYLDRLIQKLEST